MHAPFNARSFFIGEIMIRAVISHAGGRARLNRCAEFDSGRFDYPVGLRWVCVRCTHSCRDVLGHKRSILLTDHDVERVEKATGYDQSEFSLAVYTRTPYERRMKMIRGRCVFLEGSECSIYRARPLICRFYPFSLNPSMENAFQIAFDPACSGIGKGPTRSKRFFTSLVLYARRELSKC